MSRHIKKRVYRVHTLVRKVWSADKERSNQVFEFIIPEDFNPNSSSGRWQVRVCYSTDGPVPHFDVQFDTEQGEFKHCFRSSEQYFTIAESARRLWDHLTAQSFTHARKDEVDTIVE